MKIKPLYDRILVKRDEPYNAYEGLIELPHGYETVPDSGVIMAVGAGVQDDRLGVGAKVFIGRYFGHDLVFDNEDYILIREPEILAVMI
jgi:chaperonin GroES